MNKARAKRLLAFCLGTVMMLGVLPISAFAAGTSSNASSFTRTLEDVKELLDTVSYETYRERYADMPNATATVEINLDIILLCHTQLVQWLLHNELQD